MQEFFFHNWDRFSSTISLANKQKKMIAIFFVLSIYSFFSYFFLKWSCQFVTFFNSISQL
ncbi:MAG TPA: hypothetical protein DDZ41_01805 [Flavobacterium sp.]|nr:hypothetical protein [Flavobacterium sp.]